MNERLAAQHEQVHELRESGRLWTLSAAERQVVIRKVRKLQWLPVDAALRIYAPSASDGVPTEFVNVWQQEQIARWSRAIGRPITRQPAVKGFVNVLKHLSRLGTRAAILAAAKQGGTRHAARANQRSPAATAADARGRAPRAKRRESRRLAGEGEPAFTAMAAAAGAMPATPPRSRSAPSQRAAVALKALVDAKIALGGTGDETASDKLAAGGPRDSSGTPQRAEPGGLESADAGSSTREMQAFTPSSRGAGQARLGAVQSAFPAPFQDRLGLHWMQAPVIDTSSSSGGLASPMPRHPLAHASVAALRDDTEPVGLVNSVSTGASDAVSTGLPRPLPSPTLHVLSYNLNILPVGVALLGTGQGMMAAERLEAFLTVIETSIAKDTAFSDNAAKATSEMLHDRDDANPGTPRPFIPSRPSGAPPVLSSLHATPTLWKRGKTERIRFADDEVRGVSSNSTDGLGRPAPALGNSMSVAPAALYPKEHDTTIRAGRAYDVLVLQECFGSPFIPCFCRQKLLIARLRRCGYRWIAKTPAPSLDTMIRRRRFTDSGLLIASRLPIVQSDFFTFSTAGLSLDKGASKGVLYARVKLTDATSGKDHYVDVFNCHLQATHSSSGGPSADTDNEYRTAMREARKAGRAAVDGKQMEGEARSPRAACCSGAALGLGCCWPGGGSDSRGSGGSRGSGEGEHAAEDVAAAEEGRDRGVLGRTSCLIGAMLMLLSALWSIIAALACWWICLVPCRRSRRRSSKPKATAYEEVRAQQLHELVRFIQRKTHSTGYPWMLTGDFNVDAIAQDAGEGSGLAYFSGAPSTGESEAYQRLMRSLAPLGEASGRYSIRDLLKVAYGRHVSTRPPRLQFPTSIQYLLRHKYPQRLDYAFTGGGGPGHLLPDVAKTAVVEFRADELDDPAGAGARRKSLAHKLGAAQARDEPASRRLSLAGDALLGAGTPDLELSEGGGMSPATRKAHPFEYLSDHFGIDITFTLPAMQWNSGPDLSTVATRTSGAAGAETAGPAASPEASDSADEVPGLSSDVSLPAWIQAPTGPGGPAAAHCSGEAVLARAKHRALWWKALQATSAAARFAAIGPYDADAGSEPGALERAPRHSVRSQSLAAEVPATRLPRCGTPLNTHPSTVHESDIAARIGPIVRSRLLELAGRRQASGPVPSAAFDSLGDVVGAVLRRRKRTSTDAEGRLRGQGRGGRRRSSQLVSSTSSPMLSRLSVQDFSSGSGASDDDPAEGRHPAPERAKAAPPQQPAGGDIDFAGGSRVPFAGARRGRRDDRAREMYNLLRTGGSDLLGPDDGAAVLWIDAWGVRLARPEWCSSEAWGRRLRALTPSPALRRQLEATWAQVAIALSVAIALVCLLLGTLVFASFVWPEAVGFNVFGGRAAWWNGPAAGDLNYADGEPKTSADAVAPFDRAGHRIGAISAAQAMAESAVAVIGALRRRAAMVLVAGLPLHIVEEEAMRVVAPSAIAELPQWSQSPGALPTELIVVADWLRHTAAAVGWMCLAAALLWVGTAQLQPERAWACLWHALLRLGSGQLPIAHALGSVQSRTHRVIRDLRGGEGVAVVGGLASHWGQLASAPASWEPLTSFNSGVVRTLVFQGRVRVPGPRDDEDAARSFPSRLSASVAQASTAALTDRRSSSPRPDPRNRGTDRRTASLPRPPAAHADGPSRLRLPRTVYDMLLESARSYGFRECLGYVPKRMQSMEASEPPAPIAEAFTVWKTYSEVLADATCLGSGLRGLANLVSGSRVGILGFNSKEWLLTELACTCYSLTTVFLQAPISRSNSMRPLRHLERMLERSNCRIIVCDRLWTAAILQAAAEGHCPALDAVVQTTPLSYDEQIQASTSMVRLVAFDHLIAAGRAYPLPHSPPLPCTPASIEFSFRPDMALLEITHTHASTCASVLRLRAHPVGRSITRFDVHVSYLPLAFEGERCFVHLLLACGAAVGFVESSESGHLATTVARLQPTVLLVTPALLKKGFAYFGRIKRSWSRGYRMLFETALRGKRQAVMTRTRDADLVTSTPALTGSADGQVPAAARRDMWADVFIFNLLSELIGSARLRFLMVLGSTASGAALDPTVIDFVQLTLCVPVLAAWTHPAVGFVCISPAHTTVASGVDEGTKVTAPAGVLPDAPHQECAAFNGYCVPGLRVVARPWTTTASPTPLRRGSPDPYRNAVACQGMCEVLFAAPGTADAGAVHQLAWVGRTTARLPDTQRGVPTYEEARLGPKAASAGLQEGSAAEAVSVTAASSRAASKTDMWREADVAAAGLEPSDTLALVHPSASPPCEQPGAAFVEGLLRDGDRVCTGAELVSLLGDVSSVAEVLPAVESSEGTAGAPVVVVCERVEAVHLFAAGMVLHVAVMPLPAVAGGGLGAVVTVEQEECLLWAMRTSSSGGSGLEELDVNRICARPDFREWMLEELRQSAMRAGLSEAETVRRVFTTSAAISPRNCLATPVGLLRRDNVKRDFGARLASPKRPKS